VLLSKSEGVLVGAEVHRVTTAQRSAPPRERVVVRARRLRPPSGLFERDGRYHLDLFKGIETVQSTAATSSAARSPPATHPIGEATSRS
jgi:hypothetical protein